MISRILVWLAADVAVPRWAVCLMVLAGVCWAAILLAICQVEVENWLFNRRDKS